MNDNNRTKIYLLNLLKGLVSYELPEIEEAALKALNREYGRTTFDPTSDKDLMHHLQNGDKINWVHRYRELTKCSLQDAMVVMRKMFGS